MNIVMVSPVVSAPCMSKFLMSLVHTLVDEDAIKYTRMLFSCCEANNANCQSALSCNIFVN